MVTTLPKPKESPALPRPEVLPSEILERDGWCQGYFIDQQGRVCLIGAWNTALNRAASYEPPTCALVALSAVVQVKQGSLHVHNPGQFISNWNDLGAQRMGEVVAVSIEAEKRLGWRG